MIRLLKERLAPICGSGVLLHPVCREDAEIYGKMEQEAGCVPDGESLRGFVEASFKDRNRYDFLVMDTSGTLLGKASLFKMDWEAESGQVSYFLFHRSVSGLKMGEEGLELLLEFAFNRLCLHRVECALAGVELPMKPLYERAGFRLEGVRRQASWEDGSFCDQVLMGMLESEYQERGGKNREKT